MSNILILDLKQIDKVFNPYMLDMITVPQGIGKNTDKYWILNTARQIRDNNVNQFLFLAATNNYQIVAIKKPL